MSSPNTDATCRVNLLGRFAVPKAIRRQMDIQRGDSFEIIHTEDGILFRKYAVECPIAAELENAANYISTHALTFSFATPDTVNDFRSNVEFHSEAAEVVRVSKQVFVGYGEDMRARFLWDAYLNFAYGW